ncbi:hypothetical protein PT2222_490036 [Paraburkholderia tropica]
MDLHFGTEMSCRVGASIPLTTIGCSARLGTCRRQKQRKSTIGTWRSPLARRSAKLGGLRQTRGGSIRDKIRPHANGETAMRALSEEARVGAIGITQATEIKYTNHLTLVGLLPDRYRLSTTYSVAVSKGSSSDATARSLIELLTSSATRDIRHSCGFESATGGHLA